MFDQKTCGFFYLSLSIPTSIRHNEQNNYENILKKYIEKNLTFATTCLHTHTIKDIVHFFQYVQCTLCRLIAHWRLIKLLSTETNNDDGTNAWFHSSTY